MQIYHQYVMKKNMKNITCSIGTSLTNVVSLQTDLEQEVMSYVGISDVLSSVNKQIRIFHPDELTGLIEKFFQHHMIFFLCDKNEHNLALLKILLEKLDTYIGVVFTFLPTEEKDIAEAFAHGNYLSQLRAEIKTRSVIVPIGFDGNKSISVDENGFVKLSRKNSSQILSYIDEPTTFINIDYQDIKVLTEKGGIAFQAMAKESIANNIQQHFQAIFKENYFLTEPNGLLYQLEAYEDLTLAEYHRYNSIFGTFITDDTIVFICTKVSESVNATILRALFIMS